MGGRDHKFVRNSAHGKLLQTPDLSSDCGNLGMSSATPDQNAERRLLAALPVATTDAFRRSADRPG